MDHASVLISKELQLKDDTILLCEELYTPSLHCWTNLISKIDWKLGHSRYSNINIMIDAEADSKNSSVNYSYCWFTVG